MFGESRGRQISASECFGATKRARYSFAVEKIEKRGILVVWFEKNFFY